MKLSQLHRLLFLFAIRTGVGRSSGQCWFQSDELEVQNSGYTDTFRPALQSVFTVNQKLDFITKGLSAYARFSFDSYSEFNNKRTGGVDLWYTNQRDGNGELVFGKPIKEGSDELYYEHSDTGERVIYTEANISYDRTFGHHNVNGMVLYNMRNRMIATAGSAIASIPYRNQANCCPFRLRIIKNAI